MNPEIVDIIDYAASKLMKLHNLPGSAVSIVVGGKVRLTKGYGVRDTQTKVPVDKNTVFQLASVSKTFGGTMLARLVQAEKVKYSDPTGIVVQDPYVSQHNSYLDAACHRTGLPDHYGNFAETVGYNRKQILDMLQYAPITEFRAVYSYQNVFFSKAIENAISQAGYSTSRYWDEFTSELGLRSTSYTYSDFLKQTNKATQHINGEPSYFYNTDAQYFAGGVSSNAEDAGRYLKYLISADLGTEYEAGINSTSASGGYAVGTSVGYVKKLGTTQLYKFHDHSGALETGTSSQILWSKDLNCGISVMCNFLGYPLAKHLCSLFMYLAIGESIDTSYKRAESDSREFAEAVKMSVEKLQISPIRTPLASLPSGHYSNPQFGTVLIQGSRIKIGQLKTSTLHLTDKPNIYQTRVVTSQGQPIKFEVLTTPNKLILTDPLSEKYEYDLY